MKKYIVVLMATFIAASAADAQVGMRFGGRRPNGYGRLNQRKNQAQPPKFKPIVNLTFGYGFPNADKNQLAGFYNYYQGGIKQTGPFTGSLDVQFSRTMSIGLLVTHGNISTNYYSFNDASVPVLSGSLNNWAVMLNFIHYMPVSDKVIPYVRTAIGINSWKQNYTDASGNKQNINVQPGELAYQVGFGAKFRLSKNTGLFIEGGYGKYILSGGLAFKL